MNHQPAWNLQNILHQLHSSETELEELTKQLRSFEDLVDAQLGSLLDQLSDLSTETTALDAQLRHIREQHLFGEDRMQYSEGAPQPSRQPDLSDLPPLGLSNREAIHNRSSGPSAGQPIPDIKVLYRKLARRYHPDLAHTNADRSASNAQMVEINQAYNAGDLRKLMSLAGIGLPYGVELPEFPIEPGNNRSARMSEQEQAERRLKAVRQQIERMTSIPLVKLSLEVKLARHQGRNLLREMAAELQYKVGRKQAERDYLRAQIKANSGDA